MLSLSYLYVQSFSVDFEFLPRVALFPYVGSVLLQDVASCQIARSATRATQTIWKTIQNKILRLWKNIIGKS